MIRTCHNGDHGFTDATMGYCKDCLSCEECCDCEQDEDEEETKTQTP